MEAVVEVKSFCKNCFEHISGTVCSHCGYDNAAGEVKTGYLPPGAILADKYMIGRLLGHGGFGATYLGFDMTLEVKVAIKEYLPKGMASRNTDRITVVSYEGEKETYGYGLKQFVQEANTLARFNALSSVTSIYDTIEANGTAYIVMEFIEGHTLDIILRQRSTPMSVDETLGIITPILETLSKVHRAGIIHRDIAPDNILVMDSGKVKLLDFGAARYALGEKSQSLSVIVKHGFAPPEQYSARGKQGPWTDIYAICATMYVMLTGKSIPSSMDVMLGEPVHSASVLNPDVPDWLASVMAKGLQTDYSNRWQDSLELLNAINAQGKVNIPLFKELPKHFSDAANMQTVKVSDTEVMQTVYGGAAEVKAKKNKGKIFGWLAGGAAIAAAIIALVFILGPTADDKETSNIDDGTAHSTPAAQESVFSQIPAVTITPALTSALPTETVQQPIVFSDENLEKSIRQLISIPAGEIYPEDVSSVTVLDLTSMEIKDIAPLSNFVNLMELKLGDNQISDIGALSILTKLTSLELYENGIADISALSGLTNLTFLYISDNNITDIRPLSNLRSMKSLLLSGNPISDIDALQKLSQLELLHISRTGITDIRALSHCSNLKTLYMRSNQMEDISNLAGLKNLEELQLEKNEIQDISPLSNLTNLTVLHLNDNQIQDISALAGLIHLDTLYLQGNSIDDYSPVSHLNIANKDY